MQTSPVFFFFYRVLLRGGFLPLIFSFLTNHAYAENLKQFQDYFEDVLLVIYYNHPFYESIEFEKSLYSPVFKNIVFYGDRTHYEDSEYEHVDEDGNYGDFYIAYTRAGYYYSRFVKDVLERFPGYKGYIFMQDDCIMQFWHYLHLDKNKIWFGQNEVGKVNHTSSIGSFKISRIEDPEYNWWFNTTAGMPEIKKVFPRLHKEERAILSANFGKNAVPGYPADFFYLPGRFSKEAIRLCELFSKVFIEISIPTILGCMDYLQNWEELPHYWIFHSNDPNNLFEYYKPEHYWVHPLKFSMQENRDFALDIFNKQFYKTLEKN